MTMRVANSPAQAISAEQAAGFVRSGTWLDYGAGLCQPDVFDTALGARIREVTNVKIRHCLTMRPRAVLDADPEGHHVHSFSLHYSGYDRKNTMTDAAITSRSISVKSRITIGASLTLSTSSSSRPARSMKAAISI